MNEEGKIEGAQWAALFDAPFYKHRLCRLVPVMEDVGGSSVQALDGFEPGGRHAAPMLKVLPQERMDYAVVGLFEVHKRCVVCVEVPLSPVIFAFWPLPRAVL